MSIVKYEDLSPEEKKHFDDTMLESTKKEQAWFDSWGFLPGQIMGARSAYQAFIEKEIRDNPQSFYRTPLARKAFMMGWLRGLDE